MSLYRDSTLVIVMPCYWVVYLKCGVIWVHNIDLLIVCVSKFNLLVQRYIAVSDA